MSRCNIEYISKCTSKGGTLINKLVPDTLLR